VEDILNGSGIVQAGGIINKKAPDVFLDIDRSQYLLTNPVLLIE